MATAIQKFQARADERGIVRLNDGSFLELIAECDKPYVAHQMGNWKTGTELFAAYTPAQAVRQFFVMADHGDFIS